MSSSTHNRPSTRWLRIFGSAIALLAMLAIAGCGGSDDGADTSSANSGDSSGGSIESIAVLSEGSANDKSFTNSSLDGAKRAAEELGAELEFTGNLVTPDEFLRQGTAFAGQGVDLLILFHGGMAGQARQIAQQFPDTEVCVGPVQPTEEEAKTDPPNLCYWDVQQQDGSFMAGALAALMPDVDQIASINAFEFAAITRQAEGFALGARCVNPDIKFSQTYIESWTDTGKAKAAAEAMIGAGADVILAATDSAVVGIYEAAREASSPVYVLPSYFDSYDQAPDVILTSILHNLDGAIEDLVIRAENGEIGEGELLDYDFIDGDVGKLADFRDKTEVIGQDVIDEWQTEIVDKVKSGDIEIPNTVGTEPAMGTRGAGTELDPADFGCTPLR